MRMPVNCSIARAIRAAATHEGQRGAHCCADSHRKVRGQDATIARQQKAIAALDAQLKEPAALIRKVSDRLEASKPAPQMVVDNQ